MVIKFSVHAPIGGRDVSAQICAVQLLFILNTFRPIYGHLNQ